MKDATSSPIKALRASAHMFGESLNKITNGVLIAGPHYSVYGGAIITDHLIASDLINVLTDVQTDANCVGPCMYHTVVSARLVPYAVVDDAAVCSGVCCTIYGPLDFEVIIREPIERVLFHLGYAHQTSKYQLYCIAVAPHYRW